MKDKYQIAIFAFLAILLLLINIKILNNFKKVEEQPKEVQRLEVYTYYDVYYINIDSLTITAESSERIHKFNSFDEMGFFLSEQTAVDAIRFREEL